MHRASALRVALRHLEADRSVLDGSSHRKVVSLVNAVIDRAPTRGVFRDQYWQGVKAVWKTLDQQNIPYTISSAKYEHENGVPVRKVWLFEVPFINDGGRPEVAYGRVTASGAGSVDDPLAAYDVVAYVS